MREGNTDAVIREVLEYPEIIDTRDFRDKSMNALSVAQSKNIRHYAQYLKEKTSGFNDLKLDFVRQKSEVISRFRTTSVDNPFLRQLTILQRQIKALLECSFYADEIDNVVTLQAFRLLVGDMMSLFHIMNEGVICLLSGYFDLPREEAQKGLGIYKTFATQTTKTVEFFEIARKLRDSLGVEVPKFKHAPLSLAGALEEYLNAPDFDIQQQAFQAKKQASSQANASSSQKIIPPSLKQQPSNDVQSNQASSPVRAPSPIKSPEVLIDFFASTDTAAINAYSFNMPTVNTWAPSGMVLSGSSNGVVNPGFGGAASNSFAFNSTGSSVAGGASGGNPFAQQGFAQSGGFPNAGLNGSSQFGQAPSSFGFGQQLPLASASTQFGQPSAAPVDPSFTVENIFGGGGSGVGAPAAVSNNPFGSAPSNPFGANQTAGFGGRPVAATQAMSNNPFGSAPAPATGNPYQNQPQPPLPQQFKSQPQQQRQFNQQQQFGSGNPFPSASPIVQQQQLYSGSGFGGISNQPSPLLGQQQANTMPSQQSQFGQQQQQQFGFNQLQQQQTPLGGAGFNSGSNSFGGINNNNEKPGSSGPTSQVVDHFAGVNPFAKPNIPLSAMGSGANTPNQMGAIGTTLYGGNTGMTFSNLNQGMAGMNLGAGQNGGQTGGFPSVQKNNSNNPFFK
ncbi:UNVERIFIED_CONTAM: hypothetical protein HDU68_002109 [Siphonaria sp. JEL0065]|nr:hypothetical protein HDU68_002109 [Siphonaria sp. JEL0065]